MNQATHRERAFIGALLRESRAQRRTLAQQLAGLQRLRRKFAPIQNLTRKPSILTRIFRTLQKWIP